MKFGKLILEDGKKLYSLADLRQGNDDDVTMVVELCDGENAWLAELDTSYLQKNSKRLSLSLNEYCIALQLLFTNASNDSSSECEYYICQLVHDGQDSAALVWKKKLTEDDIILKMGTIDLKRQVVTRVIDKMLEFSVEHIAEIKKQFQFAKIEAERLAEERRMALQSLEKCVKAKEQLEVDLYSKFSLILNEKKLKISELLASDKGRWKEDILNQERPGPSKRLNVYDSTAHDDNDRRETLAMETTPSVATKNDGSLLNVDYSPTSESPMVPLPRKPRTLRNKTVNRPPKNNIETKSLKSKSAELLAACEMDTLELAEEL